MTMKLPEKKGPTKMPMPDHRLVKDHAMSMGNWVTSPDAAYVYTMVSPRQPPITAMHHTLCTNKIRILLVTITVLH